MSDNLETLENAHLETMEEIDEREDAKKVMKPAYSEA